MRVYELAKEHDVNAKQLVEALQAAGYEVKNTLASVDDNVAQWVEGQAKSGFPALEGEKDAPAKKKSSGSASKKSSSKKTKAPSGKKKDESDDRPSLKDAARKVEEETDTETKKDTEGKDEDEADKPKVKTKKRAKVKRKRKVPIGGLPEPEPEPEPVPEPKPEPKPEPEPEPEPEKTVEEPVAETAPEPDKTQKKSGKEEPKKSDAKKDGKKSAKKGKGKDEKKSDKKQEQKKSAKPKGKEIQLRRPAEEATAEDVESSDVVVEEEEDAEQLTGHKHKRADFRGTQKLAELPAIFADQDQSYTRSLTGGRGRRRRRGGQSHRRPRRGGRRTSTIKRERDPDAVATVAPGMSVRDLSTALGVKINDIVSYFMKSGQLVNVNDPLSEDDITLLAEEFNVKYEWRAEQDLEQELEDELAKQEEAIDEEDMVLRPPVITFLGHVDHGKTSLLDKIRSTRVAAHEAGGITQHMGAYNVEVGDNEITFLDTPGHEAFTAMRARGADLTDVAVLVVAADDGVMPQTEEACSHARNAGVPIVVAINKCDLPGANPDRVRQELSNRLELLPEEWGGTVGMVEVSAQTGQGIEDLLERILLESEILELHADPTRPATGYVIEAKVSESRGIVATILIQDGTLHRGDVVLCSTGYGKVKLLYDEHGHSIDEAGPGQPVRIVGLSNIPEAGDKVYVLEDIQKARTIAEQREREARQAALSKRSHVTLENLHAHLGETDTKELRLVIKADVKGSLEVLEKTLGDLSTDEVKLQVIHSAVGGINQADVILADASDALVVGFHVISDQTARLQASSLGVQVKIYHIIYRLIEDMKAALEGMLPPEEKEVVQGHAQIRQIFKASRLGNIAGCYVLDGVITRASRARVIRDNVVIHDGEIDTLKRFKDDAREVREGFECGIKIAGYNDIQIEDIVEAYTIEEVARKLE